MGSCGGGWCNSPNQWRLHASILALRGRFPLLGVEGGSCDRGRAQLRSPRGAWANLAVTRGSWRTERSALAEVVDQSRQNPPGKRTCGRRRVEMCGEVWRRAAELAGWLARGG